MKLDHNSAKISTETKTYTAAKISRKKQEYNYPKCILFTISQTPVCSTHSTYPPPMEGEGGWAAPDGIRALPDYY